MLEVAMMEIKFSEGSNFEQIIFQKIDFFAFLNQKN
jgi:hypothetical protein